MTTAPDKLVVNLCKARNSKFRSPSLAQSFARFFCSLWNKWINDNNTCTISLASPPTTLLLYLLSIVHMYTHIKCFSLIISYLKENPHKQRNVVFVVVDITNVLIFGYCGFDSEANKVLWQKHSIHDRHVYYIYSPGTESASIFLFSCFFLRCLIFFWSR